MSSHRAHTIAAVSSVFLLFAGPMAGHGVVAQTTASQGRPEPGTVNDVTHFQSPMVLEIPLETFDSLLQKQWVPIEDVPRYRCDGVSLQKVRVRGMLRKNGTYGLDVKLETYTVPGKDKWADIQFDLVLDGAILKSELIPQVNAEEDSTRRVSSYLEVPPDKTGSPDKPILRLTVTVTDN
jgi:hypothetical protein